VLPEYCPDCAYKRKLKAANEWKQRNRSHVKEYRDTYHAENPEKEKARCRRWREANREQAARYRRWHYETCERETAAEKMRDYRKRNPGKHAEIENRRRARLLNAFVEAVDPAAIRTRDRGLCGICGDVVAVADQSLDHVIPLARGGTHEARNIQLAHRSCNSRKGAKLLKT
jgi:5-methylcytosine-specific restriction endonuclease McrA